METGLKFIADNWFKFIIAFVAVLIGVSVFYFLTILPTKERQRTLSQGRVCTELGVAFQEKFESKVRGEGFYSPGLTFITPVIKYSNNTGTCISKNGYEYDDHGGRSRDLFIYDLNTNSAILRGSDGVRYLNEAGSYYVNPKNEDILSIDEFNNRAEILLRPE